MREEAGAARADRRHAAVPAEEGDDRGKDPNIEITHERVARRRQRPTGPRLHEVQRHQRQRADAEQHRQERDRRQLRRPATQQHGIDRPCRHAQQHGDVAAVDRQRDERGGVAAQHDDQHAGERDENAGELPRRGALAVEGEGGEQRQHRPRRIDERAVERRRPLQPDIGEAVAYGDAEQPEQQQDSPMSPKDRALGDDLGAGEGQHEKKGDAPAHQAQAQRRHGPGERAPDDHVPRPGEHGDDQQEIGARRAHARVPALCRQRLRHGSFTPRRGDISATQRSG